MKPTPMERRKAFEKRLGALKTEVPIGAVRAGDLVEYLSELSGFRFGKVVRVQPRARRVIVGAYGREDLPRGFKDLARYVSNRHRVVVVAQLTGILVGKAQRSIVRPGTDAWVTFIEARAAGADKGDNGVRTVDREHVERPAVNGASARDIGSVPSAQPAAAPNPAVAFQRELRDAFDAHMEGA